MPKTKTSSGKGLHLRVGLWHDKDVLRDAIKPSAACPEPLHREETMRIVPRTMPGGSPAVPAPAPARPQRGTASAWQTKAPRGSSTPTEEYTDKWLCSSSSDEEDTGNEPAPLLSVQGPCTLICLPDGTFSGVCTCTAHLH